MRESLARTRHSNVRSVFRGSANSELEAVATGSTRIAIHAPELEVYCCDTRSTLECGDPSPL